MYNYAAFFFFQAMSLHLAAESGRLDDVKHFLTDDNVDSADEKGVSILHIASHSSHARAYDYPWSQAPPQIWSMCCVAKIRKDPWKHPCMEAKLL